MSKRAKQAAPPAPRVQFEPRPGFVFKVPAHVRGPFIESLKQDGEVSKERVLEAAEPEDSPIHACFEWDDTKAARAHRLDTARSLLRSYVVVTVDDGGQEMRMCPANVRVVNEDRQEVFVSAAVAMSRADYRVQVIEDTMRQLKGLQRRLENLQTLDPGACRLFEDLFAALDKHIKRLHADAG